MYSAGTDGYMGRRWGFDICGFQICIVSDQIPPTYYVETPSFLYIKTIKNYLVVLSDSFQWYVITALAEVVVVQAHAAFTSERETSRYFHIRRTYINAYFCVLMY